MEMISLSTIKELMDAAEARVAAVYTQLRHENTTLRSQNESMRARLDNERLQAKLDRAQAKIVELLRGRETMLTQEQAQIVRDVAAARVQGITKERDEWKAKAEAAEAAARSSLVSDHKIIELCREVIHVDTNSALISVGETMRRLRHLVGAQRSKLDAVAKIVGRP